MQVNEIFVRKCHTSRKTKTRKKSARLLGEIKKEKGEMV